MNLNPPPDLDVRESRRQTALDDQAFLEWVFPDGTLWTQFFRINQNYLLRFPGLADFVVSASGKEAAAYPVPDASAKTIEHLFLNQVVPLALSRQFKLVLHASAIDARGIAVAFLGESGRGKSTLAASFATVGYRLLTDDGLLVVQDPDGYFVHPSHPSIRLWEDSRSALISASAHTAPSLDYTAKSRILADDEVAFCETPRPLRCMYFLGEGLTQAISIEPITGRDAMIAMVGHSFLLDVEERAMLSHHFDQLSELAKIPMFFRLDYPRRYELLPEVRENVVRHLAGMGALRPA